MIFHYVFLWIHLLSMAGLFGLVLSCDGVETPEERTLKMCRMFFGLILISGFLLAYLRITTAIQTGIEIPNGTYHILATKFVVLLGLGHFVVVGSKKNMKRWTMFSLVFIAIATLLGITLRGF